MMETAAKGAPTLRVLMLIYQFFPHVGGGERQCLTLSAALRRKGVDARVATFRLDSAWPRHETIDSVPVSRLPRLHPAESNLAVTTEISSKQTPNRRKRMNFEF